MKRKGLWIGVVIVLLVVIGLVVWQQQQPAQQEEKVIKIGAILPLTGPAAVPGNISKNALELALSQDSLDNVEIIFEDSKSQPTESVSAFRKLKNIQNVDLVISALSSVTLSILPLAENAKIPIFATLVTYPNIAKKSKWLFRAFINNAAEAELMADFIANQMRITKIGVFYSNDDGGLGSKEEFVKEFKSLGCKISFEEGFNVQEVSFRSIITKKINSSTENVFVIGYGRGLGNLIKQIKEIDKNINIFSMAQFGSPDAKLAAGEAGQGVYYTAPAFNFLKTSIKEYFIQTYKERFNSTPNFIAAYSYDIGRIILKGIEISMKNKVTLYNAFYKIKNVKGVTGKLSVSEFGEISSDLVIVKSEDNEEVFVYSK